MGGAMLAGWLREGVEGNRISVVDPSPPPAMTKLILEGGVGHFSKANDAGPVDIEIGRAHV